MESTRQNGITGGRQPLAGSCARLGMRTSYVSRDDAKRGSGTLAERMGSERETPDEKKGGLTEESVGEKRFGSGWGEQERERQQV